ncbi:MAG TPA: NirA family protein [Stellaceae bacterium]
MAEAGLSEEQKRYLEGFMSGIAAKRAAPQGPPAAAAEIAASDIHRQAQDRFLAQGKSLTPEETAKRQGHPLDIWDELVANSAAGRFPNGLDVFRHKFFGLFYTAPAQDSFMCRLRMPNGSLDAYQLHGIADIAERYGGGYADVTTRANLQIREIAAGNAVAVLMALQDLGLTSRGSGADNIRNITGSPTAGIDPQELIDTRPLARLLHHHVLNHRELYGLPRKFNIAFDGGGRVGVLEDTNDIGFAAVAAVDGAGIPPGVYFRMQLGGVTGHGDFAADAGVMLAPEQCVPMAAAVLRVFIAHGDRTDRKRARLKYLLADWGLERFMAAVAEEIPFRPLVAPLSACKPRRPVAKHGHIGVHPQQQPGFFYIGIVLPVGRLTAPQLRGLADAARELGSGEIRLTVWQNLVLCDIPDDRLAEAEARIAALGLATTASGIRGGLVACTGNTGCKFAATDTKGQALAIARYLESRVPLDQPINIHLTGCPNSCAQHYVGDIGLLGIRVGDDMVEGYTICVGGGAGSERSLAREIRPNVPMAEIPQRLERMLRAYLAQRRDPAESFHEFTGRCTVAELQRFCD